MKLLGSKTLEEQKTEIILKLFNRKPMTVEQISDVFFRMETNRKDGNPMSADELMVQFARAIEKAHGIE